MLTLDNLYERKDTKRMSFMLKNLNDVSKAVKTQRDVPEF